MPLDLARGYGAGGAANALEAIQKMLMEQERIRLEQQALTQQGTNADRTFGLASQKFGLDQSQFDYLKQSDASTASAAQAKSTKHDTDVAAAIAALPEDERAYAGMSAVNPSYGRKPQPPAPPRPLSGIKFTSIDKSGKPVEQLRDPTTNEQIGGDVPSYQKPDKPLASDNPESLARMDRSYQSNISRLDAMRKPIADRAERMGRLVATVDEQSPQADAVIAPELITVMAGGAGSGVRITTAEIEAVLGGRSNWESVKAALNKWRLDPSQALSVTPAQRQQIKTLLGTISERINAQLGALDEGAQGLIDAKTVDDHRRILTDTQKKMDAIGLGGGRSSTAGGTVRMRAPNGQEMDVAADQVKHYESLGAKVIK